MKEKIPDSGAGERADKFRLILQNVREFAIFSTDLNGSINEWNPGAERLFGYHSEEILGKPMELLYVPEDRVAGKAEMEKALAASTGFSEDERWHLRKDGSRMFVIGMVNAMYEDNGKLCGFIKVARDITPRKILEERLAASEAQHRLILDAIEDFAIITLALDGRIESWNPGATSTFGYEPQEAIGRDLSMLFTPEERTELLPERVLSEVRRDGLRQTEGWALRKDGTRIFVIDSLRLISPKDGQPTSILKVSRDITLRHITRMNLETTRRELERAHQELEVKVEHRTTELRESSQFRNRYGTGHGEKGCGTDAREYRGGIHSGRRQSVLD